MSEMNRDRVRNHLHPERPFRSESGPIIPSENVAINGMNFTPYSHLASRSSEYPSSSFTTDVPLLRVPTSASQHVHYHHQSAASSSQFPPNYAQQALACHTLHTIHGDGGAMNIQTEHGRGSFKRKHSEIAMFYDVENTNGYYAVGSSSNLPMSSDHVQQKPITGSLIRQYEPMIPNYGGSRVLVVGEGSQRNVRSRHENALHMGTNPSGSHLSSNLPGPPNHFHSTGVFPVPNMMGQWSHNGHRRAISSGSGSRELNQPFVGSSSSGLVEMEGGNHASFIPSRNITAPLPVIHVPSAQSVGSSSSYGQRTVPPHRSMPSYPPYGIATSLEEGGQLAPQSHSRNTRPLPISGPHSSERHGWVRSSYGRLPSFPEVDNAHGRWISEGLMAVDRSTFYDPRNLLMDQHQDMRLDIDNLSYEELLALEERIGNVSTGLSDDLMSRCLTETIYCSSDEVQEEQEENCVICLEKYQTREELGVLKCGHNYHLSCIKQWLQVKNICPICKSSALEK